MYDASDTIGFYGYSIGMNMEKEKLSVFNYLIFKMKPKAGLIRH